MFKMIVIELIKLTTQKCEEKDSQNDSDQAYTFE